MELPPRLALQRAGVHAAVLTVATAAAIWATVKPTSTATSDENCQTGLCLFERRERHRFGGGDADRR